MKLYKTILIALELNESSDQRLIEKAREYLKKDAKVYLAHSVEHFSSYGVAYGVSAGVDVEEMLLEESKESMEKVGQTLGIPKEQQIVKVGPAKFLILEEAKALQVDLIMVGSHGRHGVRLLLGSTANSILHGANCDVLAVRLKD